MTATKRKAFAIKFLFIAAIWVCPAIGCLWILAGIIDFRRVRSFERPIFCILLAESAFPNGRAGTYTGLAYSFEIKGSSGITEYTAKIMNTPVMTGVRD